MIELINIFIKKKVIKREQVIWFNFQPILNTKDKIE
jgi:hypothetical protein